MLISVLTGLHTQHKITDELYNRAYILVNLIKERSLEASIYLNKNNLLEFKIKSLIITFFAPEDLRCTINNEIQRLTFNRYYLIPMLDALIGENNE